jgi:hypothetical protein
MPHRVHAVHLPRRALAGLLSLALLSFGGYHVWAWYVGEIVETGWLIVCIALLLWSVSGHSLILLTRRRGEDKPRSERGGTPTSSSSTKI